MKVLVTGNAGFIGFHTTMALLERGDDVVGFDCVNDYYDPTIKEKRLERIERKRLESNGSCCFIRADLSDRHEVEKCFGAHAFDRVIHLAAQAGVRYSLENPHAYVQSNILGFTNILEACRHSGVGHLTYASTSSVYGANTKLPFSEHDGTNHPVQFYAATKKANELMAHSYSHLFQLPTTGLRFFTVYGPWGRPDMALFLFTRKILAGEPIDVFNFGRQTRDFTYVDDIVEGVIRASDAPARANPDWDSAHPDPATSNAPYRIYNIGNNAPVALTRYIEAIEAALGRKAICNFIPPQPGDVPDTCADISDLAADFGFTPSVGVEEGVGRFVAWYLQYHA